MCTGQDHSRGLALAPLHACRQGPLFGEAVAMIRGLDEDTEDAAQWWRAYVLAENDQVEELRELAADGDGHARRQLASWLSDRARSEEATEVIRPLADTGDDIAELWLARWMAGGDHLDELRQRAASGGYHALRELTGWLADHGCLEELHELVVDQSQLLLSWMASHHRMDVVRVAADFGDDYARQRLERWLARLPERANGGDHYARQLLAEWLDEP